MPKSHTTHSASDATAYHQDAERFDRMADEGRRTRLALPAYLRMYRAMGLLPWIESQPPDEPVLELGCCDGLHLLNLAEATGRPGLGVDVSAASLRAGKDQAAERNVPVRFARMDALRTGLPDAQFRTVLFFNTLHHFFFQGFDAALAEAARLLHPEGRLFIAELNLQYPYHVVAFVGAQVIKRFARIDCIERNFTDNEMALWPGKIVRGAQRTGLEPVDGSLGYFSYVAELPAAGSEESPWLFRAARGVCRLVGRLGPKSWRHDCLHLALERRHPAA